VMITLEQAKALRHGDVVHEDHSCKKWRVSGKVRLWKTRPEKVKVPLKHGLFSHGYLTEHELGRCHMEEDCNK
jgi:hypothetical protein